MAYGQTSSGKTYTMGTGAPTSETRGGPSEGIIPRAVTQLFLQAKKLPPVYPGYKIPPLKTTFRVSFVEVYNEDLIDLLVKGDFRPPVTIREDAKGNIYWTGVQEIVVSTVEEVIHLLWFGSQNRQTHSTEMNEKSSRSHAIFSITLRQEKFVPTHPPPPQSAVSTDSQLWPKRIHSKAPSSNSLSNSNGVTPGAAVSGRPGTPSGSAMSPGGAVSGRPGTPSGSGIAPPSAAVSGRPGTPSGSGIAPPGAVASARPGTPTTPGSSIPTPYTSGIVAPGSKLRRQSTMMDVVTAAAQLDDPEPEGEWVVLNSKFHFVDLAGSERLKRTSAIGDRAKEGISINAGLHALGNVISALGDPSKKASHVPYRDSKLTRLLQDSLGGNALALMIACVSPSELNLGETLNTLKYANRARNIKNSSSVNQELNMDNPEYLRTVIQKLKLEIKVLKEASAAKAAAATGTGDMTPIPGLDSATPKGMHANRYSFASASSLIPGNIDDSTSEERAMSPSPSSRLSHQQSRDSIATDISHAYLDVVPEVDTVHEEDDRYSNASSSAATTVAGVGDNTSSVASLKSRPNIPPITIPPSADSKSFPDFVEPIIEEYEKVISGLESHLAVTQAALNHSKLMLEEQQTRIENIEDENRIKQHKKQGRRMSSDSDSDGSSSFLHQQQQELEIQLQRLRDQLQDTEARKIQSDHRIKELEQKLEQEHSAAQEQIQKAFREKEELRLQSESSSPSPPSLIKERELKAISDRILELEEQCRSQQEKAEAEAESLRLAQIAREESPTADLESERDREERDANEIRREEELIEILQAKAALEIELESEKARHELLIQEVEELKASTSHARTEVAHVKQESDDKLVAQLGITSALAAEDASKTARVQELETQLAEARDSERLLKDEAAVLVEKLEKLEKDNAAALEMEEMLHMVVSDLEGRLKSSQESESKQQEELELNLGRIRDLEERSTRAEQDALKMVEELKAKLADSKTTDEDHLAADRLLVLLGDLEQERTKVETLQTQVENQLAELAAERSRAAELETDRDAIQAQWNADKERIHTLEKEIEEHAAEIREKEEIIATLEGRVHLNEGTHAAREQLELELSQRVNEHGEILAAKVQLEQELSQRIIDHDAAVAAKSLLEQELSLRVGEHGEVVASKLLLEQLLSERVQERDQVLTAKSELEKELSERVDDHNKALAAKLELEQELNERISEHGKALAAKLELEQELGQKASDHDAVLAVNQELEQELNVLVNEHDKALAAKLELEQELSQKTAEHDAALAAKLALIQDLKTKVLSLETTIQSSDEGSKELVVKVQDELSEALEQLKNTQLKEQEQQQALQELTEKIKTLDADALTAKESLSRIEMEHSEAVQVLETKVKLAEADRDDAETRLEEAERRHLAVDDEIKSLQVTVATHLATIDLLHSKLSEARSQSPPSSRPVSTSSSAVFGLGEEPSQAIQRLEKEKARYRALVRENEKEIERLSQDLESLASEFSDAATAFEDAEEEMKARITELESLLGEKNISRPNNLSTTSLASSLASNFSGRRRDGGLHPSSALNNAQLSALKAERDQALQSSEELSSIVAELNEKNHSLQERLLHLEREQESIKLQHIIERQEQDRNLTPSPVSANQDEEKAVNRHERKPSSSSDQFANSRAEDSLMTPRQSWSTNAPVQPQPTSQARNGRHESTLIQQAKQIKMLEERIAELQGNGGPLSPGVPPTPTSVFGLGIHDKNSDPELPRSTSTLSINRQSSERMSPAFRALSTFGPAVTTPPTPPPTVPLPPPPASAAPPKIIPAHIHGSMPPSPRMSGVISNSEPRSPTTTRSDRAGSIGRMRSASDARRERDSTVSIISESANNGPNPGWVTPTNNSMSAVNISAATAQALQGVEVNELRGVVDTLAHQVQALKVEQTMHQGKIHRLEAALADAEDRLKSAREERDTTAAQKESLAKELEQVRSELAAAKIKSDKDKAGLESIVERERREREKAVETKAIMEARMEELMGRKSKFACF
ncbi:hypothetical protein BGZ99_002166 [Dissophora globulifera]|uniref:Kinesin motor domain-containing protein n=1 Tax=Dissophora globulifera TaxID=979702 RepID=A0A9P6UXH8_9FUNG|nr:hypothetical protein BGZ99_002166 [Dissophora globulifera]